MTIKKTIDYIGAKERLNKLVKDVHPEDTENALWDLAWQMTPTLSAADRDVAAALYVHSLCKERHREKVSALERGATKASAKAHKKASFDAREQLKATMQMALQAHTTAVEMEWTTKLLRSTFSLSDGTKVSWGKATIEQHRECIENLLNGAQGSIETAARHQFAVHALESVRAACLLEL